MFGARVSRHVQARARALSQNSPIFGLRHVRCEWTGTSLQYTKASGPTARSAQTLKWQPQDVPRFQLQRLPAGGTGLTAFVHDSENLLGRIAWLPPFRRLSSSPLALSGGQRSTQSQPRGPSQSARAHKSARTSRTRKSPETRDNRDATWRLRDSGHAKTGTRDAKPGRLQVGGAVPGDKSGQAAPVADEAPPRRRYVRHSTAPRSAPVPAVQPASEGSDEELAVTWDRKPVEWANLDASATRCIKRLKRGSAICVRPGVK